MRAAENTAVFLTFKIIVKRGVSMHEYDTIAAISTSIGEGGIGIIRVSGDMAEEIAEKIFKPGYAVFPLNSHRLYYGHIVNPQNGEKIDEVLLSFMAGPQTFTREDIVEINCHGGIIPLRKILDITVATGARLAEPGEFTKRAFLNGRLDLAQAESLLQIIRAKTDDGLKAALGQLEGNLSKEIKDIRQIVLMLLARLEAAIDFPEEDMEDITAGEVRTKSEELKIRINKLLQGMERGKIYRDGVETVIIGRPNVGKSSLLNALLREQKAIVTEIPGTTRDLLEDYININGIPLKIIDTAGIRETEDKIESIGVNKARTLIEKADLIILVLNASEVLTHEDKEIIYMLQDKNVIVLLNKSDLGKKIDATLLKKIMGEVNIITSSLIKGEGLEELEEEISQLFFSGKVESNRDTFVASARQRQALVRAYNNLVEVIDNPIADPELLSIDLKSAYTALGEITGETVGEDILDKIFSEFCIGK